MRTTLGVVALLLFAFACNRETSAPAAETATTAEVSAPQTAAVEKKDNFLGSWVGVKSSDKLTITAEGSAYVVEDGDGKKYVGTAGDGVLRISGPLGPIDALYTPSNEHLIVAGKEYERFDPVASTIADMKKVGEALQKYAADHQGQAPQASHWQQLRRELWPQYIFPSLPQADGWGNEYEYRGDPSGTPSGYWSVRSAGPDGKFYSLRDTEELVPGVTEAENDDLVYANGKLVRYPPGITP
jgi:hypothetical protein